MDLLLMDEDSAKLRFADALLRSPNTSRKAMFEIASKFSTEWGTICKIANEWPRDPVVIAEKEKLLAEHGKKSFMISREDLSNEIVEVARKAHDIGDKHKMYRLFAEMNGMIEKPTTNINNNIQNNVANRVMVIREKYNSDDDWAEKLQKQQEELVKNV